MIKIRKALAEDCPVMLDLIKELAIYENAPDEVTVSLKEFEENGFGENPIWHAFVAIDENKVIGMALCYFRYSTWKGKRLYLEDIIITEKYRNQKIGTMLMETCIAFGKGSDCNGMVWQVLDWNTPAIKFYKKYHAVFDKGWLNVSINF